MNPGHIHYSCISLFGAVFLFAGCRQEAWDCLLLTRIMVLFSKWKWQKSVIQCKGNKRDWGWVQIHLTSKILQHCLKCSACFQETTRFKLSVKTVTLKKDRMNFSSSKTCRSLTSECFLANNSLPPFLSLVRGYFTGSKNTQRGSLRKVLFPEPVAHYQKKKKKRNSWKCLLCLLFSLFPCITGYELAFGFWDCFLQNPETLAWPEWEMSPIHLPWKEHLWWRSVVRLSFSPLRGAGENIYHHSLLRR